MINSISELAAVLGDTLLEGASITKVPIAESDAQALIVEVADADSKEAVRQAQNLAATTGRWAVYVVDFGDDPEQLFSRFGFDENTEPGLHVSPEAIVDRSRTVDSSSMLIIWANRHGSDFEQEIANLDDYHIFRDDSCRPSSKEIANAAASGEIASPGEVKRWILNWELSNLDPQTYKPVLETEMLNDWFSYPEMKSYIVFLPTADSWATTSFIHFWDSGSDMATVMLKKWRDDWNASVVAHHGTMLHFDVVDPPKTIEAASELAWEHYLIAAHTIELPGISMYDYAYTLVGQKQWFLHQRP